MRLLMARCGSVDFDQLVLLSSIVRPAAHRWIGTYLERLHEFRRTGVQQDAYLVSPPPRCAALLSDSFGVLSYQEDVMLVAHPRSAPPASAARDQNRLAQGPGPRRHPAAPGLARARGFHEGCAARGVSLEGDHQGVGDDPELRRLLLLQGPLRQLRHGQLRLRPCPEGAQPCALPRPRHPQQRRLLLPAPPTSKEARRAGVTIHPASPCVVARISPIPAARATAPSASASS